MPTQWTLERSFESSHGTIAYDQIGRGESIILVHGTPSSSYLWRNVVEELSDEWTVHLLDLAGFGQSEKFESQDVSLKTQGKILSEFLDHRGLEEINIAGHDYGAATILRTHLIYGHQYRAMAIIDGVVRMPWITEFSSLVRDNIEVFQAVSEHIHRQLLIGHIKSAIYTDISSEELEPYLTPWLGENGQSAYYRQVAQFNEEYTDEIQSDYSSISVPTLVAWGKEDSWIPLETGMWLNEEIPNSTLRLIQEAGHFAPEDAPVVVSSILDEHFRRMY